MSFEGVATGLGLAKFWHGGSKQPAIAALLKLTFEHESRSFSELIVRIVQAGIGYRSNKGTPLTRREVDTLNALLSDLELKIPELHEQKFLERLPSDEAPTLRTDVDFATLKRRLKQLMELTPQARGYEFEKFLNELFEAFGLVPNEPFRIRGEQVDGSFELDGETYLVEATWRNEQVGAEELNAFSGKVSGKARWSRGCHISYAGYTQEGLDAFARGKQTNLICMDGLDLVEVLDREIDLSELIKKKVRRAAETNDSFASLRELYV